MSSFVNTYIHTGFWTDWSSGSALGRTLTLAPPYSSFFNSFIASFVFVTATAEWRLLNYFIHQLRATDDAQDGLSHQIQVGLRNAGDPTAALYTNLQQFWRWSKVVRGAKRWCLALAFFNLSFAIAIPASAILSALVTSDASKVRLLQGDACGVWVYPKGADFAEMVSSKFLKDTEDAANYAGSCYNQAPDPLRCGTYPTSNLQSVLVPAVECPFAPELCATRAAQITSELLDSRQHLGINTPMQESVTFQKRTTCVPLVLQGFSNKTNGIGPGQSAPNTTFLSFSYGSLQSLAYGNFTWAWNPLAASLASGYTITSFSASPGNDGEWLPIPQLQRSDADVSIHFIVGASVLYRYPSDDPIFGAHQHPGSLSTVYTSDYSVSPLGCLDQYQTCNPITQACSGWLSSGQTLGALADGSWASNNMSVTQQATLTRLAFLAPFLGTWSQVGTRGALALLVQEKVYQGREILSAVPSNQWTIEMSNWFNTSMARLQRGMADFITGDPGDLGDNRLLNLSDSEAVNDALKKQCKNQIVRDTQGSVSFSVFGFSLTFGLGGFIILLSLCLEPIMEKVNRRWFARRYHKSVQWAEDNVFHIHRRQYEVAGLGGRWKHSMSNIPCTETDISFHRNSNSTGCPTNDLVIDTDSKEADMSSIESQRVDGLYRTYLRHFQSSGEGHLTWNHERSSTDSRSRQIRLGPALQTWIFAQKSPGLEGSQRLPDV